MKRKIRIFMVVFWALIATTTMLKSKNKIEETRQGVYEVYKKIVNAENTKCADYREALKLVEVYKLLTDMDREATNEDKKVAASMVDEFRKAASKRCTLPNPIANITVPIAHPGPGIEVSIEVPVFIYSTFYMPDSLKAKYLSKLPQEQREDAARWLKENVKVTEVMNSKLEDELKRHEPERIEKLLEEHKNTFSKEIRKGS